LRITSSSQNGLRILVADADPFFRRGLREILNESEGLRVEGEAADGEQTVQLVREARGLDLVLLDIALPDALGCVERLSEENPELGIVILAGSPPDVDVIAAVQAGAIGVLGKHTAPGVLVKTLLAFQRGECLAMSREVGEALLDYVRRGHSEEAPDAGPRLTAREREVLTLISAGARDRDIAQRLVVSESTVKKHVQNILRKFQARNRAEAVAHWRAQATQTWSGQRSRV
jgi:DNA-binding NarL/FixJ family response regulator